jgi:hypothetical protein
MMQYKQYTSREDIMAIICCHGTHHHIEQVVVRPLVQTEVSGQRCPDVASLNYAFLEKNGMKRPWDDAPLGQNVPENHGLCE